MPLEFEYFRRETSDGSIRVKTSTLAAGIAVLEQRRWRVVEYVCAHWARLEVLLRELEQKGGIGHTLSTFSRTGWLELTVRRDRDDRCFANVGEEATTWHFDWLGMPPEIPLCGELARSIMRSWRRGCELNSAKAAFDLVLESLIRPRDARALPVLPEGGYIRSSTLYEFVINNRSYWYKGVWLTPGQNRLIRVAWPDNDIKQLRFGG